MAHFMPIDPSVPARGAPSGFVVSDLTLVALCVLAAVGAAADRTLPVALCALVLILSLLARLWARVALQQVHYECEASSTRAFEGDEIVLTLSVENRKWLPVPWLELREQVPAGLELLDGEPVAGGVLGSTWLVATTALAPRERVRLSYRLRARHRGHFRFGPARLAGGDPFGFYESRRALVHASATLVVYPRFAEQVPTVRALARPIGDVVARPRAIDDPTLPVSVREYRSGDSARAIDWKTTARRGAPWVRLNDASVSGSLVLLIECETRRHGAFDQSPELLESLVRTSAAIARDLLAAGHAVGMVVNGVPPGDHARTAIAPGAGPAQLTLLLDALARVQPMVLKPLSALLDAHAARVLPFGSSVVCVAGMLPATSVAMLLARARRGTRTVLVDLGGVDTPALPGVEVLRMAPARAAA